VILHTTFISCCASCGLLNRTFAWIWLSYDCWFVILCEQKRRVMLSPEQASDFYHEHHGKLFFPLLISYMSSGPIVVWQLARERAVAYWREMIGPTNPNRARLTHPDRRVLLDQWILLTFSLIMHTGRWSSYFGLVNPDHASCLLYTWTGEYCVKLTDVTRKWVLLNKSGLLLCIMIWENIQTSLIILCSTAVYLT